jgi:putative Holliday junction resolvase
VRVLGLDIGSRRIGVAVSDPRRVVASPYAVLHRAGDRTADHRAVAELVAEVEAALVVVGLPRSLDGRIGPAARQVLDEVEQLRTALPVPVECHDERLSTVSAERSLREAGVRGRDRRAVVDKVAAAVLLQSWLDSQPATEEEQ